MEQQQKKQEEAVAAAAEKVKKVDEKPALDEMSVDQLNSLSAEERRDQMLKALDKRIN